MTAAGYATLFIGLLLASAVFCRLALGPLRRYARLEGPSHGHADAVPRGAGLVLVPLLLAVFAAAPALDGRAVALPLPLLAGALVLAAASWWDDRGGLGLLPRLAVQVGAVLVGLAALADQPPVFQGLLPRPLDLAAAGLIWLWFLNLFNFMDGSDGMAGGEAAMIGLGLAAIAFDRGWNGIAPIHGLALCAIALGFLVWNRPPARLLLGDVGSLPLGYLVGWLLLMAAARGGWAAALILPGYFFADTGVTLLLRWRRGGSIFDAHREHFYQRAIRAGRSHGQVVAAMLLADCALALLAFGAERGERLAGLVGAGLTGWLILRVLARTPAGGRGLDA
jgi:UDP-N-acetylmuramyl pentapeptide phosphotransferase/UDP-N-acetylglucosamine-1-phosphate transferase